MSNETKKRKLEKLSDELLGKDRDGKRIIERLDAVNQSISLLTDALKERAAVRIENLDEIAFPAHFKIENIGDFPTRLSIANFPEIQKVSLERPDWWQEPVAPKFPEKIAIDWENAPAQKDEQPAWIPDLLKTFFEALANLLSRIASKTISVKLERGEITKPQFVIQLDPETGKPAEIHPPVLYNLIGGGGSGTASTVDVTDRAARLLGIVYGNLAQLQQKATTLELLTYDNNLATVLGTVSLLSAGRLKTEAAQSGAWSVSVSNFPATYDVSDRAARLLGIVYGNLGQLQQRAATLELHTWDKNLETVLGTASLLNAGRLKTEASPLAGSVWDISDRAARLLGVIYGSQAQQIKQTATNFNLAAELFVNATAIDPRQIRALTSADVVSAVQSGAWTVNIGTFPNNEPFNLNQYGGVATTLGQKLMASSMPIVIASDQSAIPASNALGSQVDGHSASIGATTDAEATGNGSVIAILKRLRTLLGGIGSLLAKTQDGAGNNITSELAASGTDRGLHSSDIVKVTTTSDLQNVNTTYNDVTTSANSENINCERYRKFTLYYHVENAGTPTDIQIIVQFSADGGTTWRNYMNDQFGDLRFSNASTDTAIDECVTGDCIAPLMRIRVVASGTTSANTFTVSGLRLTLKN